MLKTEIKGVQVYGLTSSLPINNKISYNANPNYFVSLEDQTASDLGYHAAKRLLEHLKIEITAFGFLIFASRTPDYRSPITAAILQSRLQFTEDCICYDVNLGSNAFIQMIQLGASVLKNQNKEYGLLIFGDTPSKLRKSSKDHHFEISDAATAIVLRKHNEQFTIEFRNVTLGNYYEAQILRHGGFREYNPLTPFDSTDLNNFVVTENKDLFLSALDTCKEALIDFLNAPSKVFCHSNLYKYEVLENQNYLIADLKADASELPIALANHVNNIEEAESLTFCSMGEGIAIYTMRMNHAPICLNTAHSDEIFTDFRVSHDI